jgi:hypothetical protein
MGYDWQHDARWRRNTVEAMWVVDAKGEANGWDCPPRLFFVLAFVHDGKPALAVAEVPDLQRALDTGADLVQALILLSYSVTGVAPPAPYELIGVLLVVEAWQLRVDDPDHLPIHGRIADHPDRIEVRSTHAVLADGFEAVLSHERDGAPVLHRNDDNDVVTADGSIPSALRRLVTAARGTSGHSHTE